MSYNHALDCDCFMKNETSFQEDEAHNGFAVYQKNTRLGIRRPRDEDKIAIEMGKKGVFSDHLMWLTDEEARELISRIVALLPEPEETPGEKALHAFSLEHHQIKQFGQSVGMMTEDNPNFGKIKLCPKCHGDGCEECEHAGWIRREEK